jgi:hypothetical protein
MIGEHVAAWDETRVIFTHLRLRGLARAVEP